MRLGLAVDVDMRRRMLPNIHRQMHTYWPRSMDHLARVGRAAPDARWMILARVAMASPHYVKRTCKGLKRPPERSSGTAA